MDTVELLPASPHTADPILRLAVAAHLARYKGQTRVHTDSDLRSYIDWCVDHGLAPLEAQRTHVELYLRWLQEVRRLKPSTVSRRLSVLSGFYRTCVIDGVLEHSPAEYVRRPHVPPESPTLGLSHLQFEAMLCAGRDSTNINDFALVALLGLLGLRVFEATGADIEALSEVRGHRVLRVHGKGDKIALVPLPPAVSRAIDRAADSRERGPLLRQPRRPTHGSPRRDTSTPGARARCRPLHRSDAPAHAPTHVRHHHARRRRRPARRPDRRHGTPIPEPRCATTAHAPTSTATPTTSSRPTWHQRPDAPICR